MQTNITNDATNATTSNATETTGTPPTLADYLEARADEVRRAQESLQRQQQRELEQKAERYLSNWAEVIDQVSPGLRRALELGEPQYIDKTDENDEDIGDYYNCVEATFPLDGETWLLRYWNGGLYVCGPNDNYYNVQVERRYITGKGWSYNRDILDAISAYPQWLTDQQERTARRAAEAAEAAEAAAKAKQEAEQPKRYTAIEGSNPARHLIHTGAMVCINYARYYGEDGSGAWGKVEAFDQQSILLTLASGRQLLINRRHIESIEPVHPTPQAEQQTEPAATHDTTHDTADEIPF